MAVCFSETIRNFKLDRSINVLYIFLLEGKNKYDTFNISAANDDL